MKLNILPIFMRRSIGIASLFTLLAAPISALALAGSPAALLSQMNFRGNPHTMEMELHMHHEETHISLWMKGASEGKTPAQTKAWEEFTVDIASDGHFLRAKGAIRAVHGTAYIKLLSVEGDPAMDMEAFRSWTQKPWIKITMPEESMQQPSFIAGFTMGMQAIDSAITEEDVRTVLNAVTDALFTLESERFQSGMAYSLRLAPHGLHKAMQAVQSSMMGDALGFHLEQMDLPGNLPINLHIRVNTNTTGELVFAKWYAATEMEGTSLVLQGKTQWKSSPVNVEIPKETMSWEEFSGEWDREMMEMGSMNWEMPTDDWNEILEDEDEWLEDEEGDDDQWESDDNDLPSHVLPPRAHHWNRIPQGNLCTATPGTSAFLQQARKGSCNLPARVEYRINDISDFKALNPRKTRLKNPYIR